MVNVSTQEMYQDNVLVLDPKNRDTGVKGSGNPLLSFERSKIATATCGVSHSQSHLGRKNVDVMIARKRLSIAPEVSHPKVKNSSMKNSLNLFMIFGILMIFVSRSNDIGSDPRSGVAHIM